MVSALPLVVRICDRAEQAGGALWKFRFQPLVPNTSEERMVKARFKGPNRERGNWTRVQIEIRIEILEYEGVQCLIEVV